MIHFRLLENRMCGSVFTVGWVAFYIHNKQGVYPDGLGGLHFARFGVETSWVLSAPLGQVQNGALLRLYLGSPQVGNGIGPPELVEMRLSSLRHLSHKKKKWPGVYPCVVHVDVVISMFAGPQSLWISFPIVLIDMKIESCADSYC